jgi:hypothetical protein
VRQRLTVINRGALIGFLCYRAMIGVRVVTPVPRGGQAHALPVSLLLAYLGLQRPMKHLLAYSVPEPRRGM